MASSSSLARMSMRSSKDTSSTGASTICLVIDQLPQYRVHVAPVLAVSVFQQGEQLQERAQALPVLEAVVLGDLLEQLDVFLVEDAAVLVADLGGSPLHVRAIHAGRMAPACPADGSPHDAGHLAEDAAAVRDGCLQRILIGQRRRHAHVDE